MGGGFGHGVPMRVMEERRLPFECGARTLTTSDSIGRITEGLLLDVAKHVDVVEPIAKFTEKLAARADVDVANVGLEEWMPLDGVVYDVVWNQWCVGHLTDEQLGAYLRRCRGALAPDGFIVVKENLARGAEDLFDEVDSSVTRYVGRAGGRN